MAFVHVTLKGTTDSERRLKASAAKENAKAANVPAAENLPAAEEEPIESVLQDLSSMSITVPGKLTLDSAKVYTKLNQHFSF
jgi:hypothetical protein